MENAMKKQSLGASIGQALWMRQGSIIFPHTKTVFIVNALAVLFILINFRVSNSTIFEWFVGSGELRHSLGQFFDIATLTLCALNCLDIVSKVGRGLWTNYASAPIPLTPVQKRLLGIAQDDSRFQSPPRSLNKRSAESSAISSPSSSPFSFGDLSWLFQLTPKKRRSSPGTPSINSTINSPGYNYYSSPMASGSFYGQHQHQPQTPTSALSPYRVRFSPNVSNYNYQMAIGGTSASKMSDTAASFEDALESVRRRTAASEFVASTPTDDRSPLRSILKKSNTTPAFSSTMHDMMMNASMTSEQSFKSVGSWRSISEDHQQSPGDHHRGGGGGGKSVSIADSSFGTPAKLIDFSPLSAYRYQPAQNVSIDSITTAQCVGSSAASATSVPSSSKRARTNRHHEVSDDEEPPDYYSVDTAIWNRFTVYCIEAVDEQCHFLRRWISETILKPLIQEIDQLNSKATKSSMKATADFVIGESSLLHLQAIAASKFDQYATLGVLLPYLELTSNQAYFVERLRELGAHDSCMKDFRWNGGSAQFKGKPWDDRLPTDTDLVAHVFATYLNSRLALNPLCPEGKSFSSKYFVQHPEKPPVNRPGGYLVLYRNTMSPPNFQLLAENDTLEVAKGKNNLFVTLLLFFHYIDGKHGSQLDSVSLAPWGLNVLWVLTE